MAAQDAVRHLSSTAATFSASRTFDRTATAAQVVAGLDLHGFTALVTGCSAGIGLATASALLSRGAHVVALVRDPARGERVRAASPHPGLVTTVRCDLTRLDSVFHAAEATEALRRPLDALITNAGIFFLPERVLVNGIEKQFCVDHLAHSAVSGAYFEDNAVSVPAAPMLDPGAADALRRYSTTRIGEYE